MSGGLDGYRSCFWQTPLGNPRCCSQAGLTYKCLRFRWLSTPLANKSNLVSNPRVPLFRGNDDPSAALHGIS